MSLDRVNSQRKLASVIDSAKWLARLQNVPEDVKQCLQLIQFVYRDVQYLAELKDEAGQSLTSVPRESQRVEDVLTATILCIEDLDSLFDRYRYYRDEKGSADVDLKWLLSDAESFALRSRTLQVQHATVLNEIGNLRSFRLAHPILVATKKTENRFKNLELLNSFAGGSPTVPGAPVPRAGPFSRASISAQPEISSFDVLGRPQPPPSSTQAPALLPLASQPSVLNSERDAPSPPPLYGMPNVSSLTISSQDTPNSIARPRTFSTYSNQSSPSSTSPTMSSGYNQRFSETARSVAKPSARSQGLRSLFQSPVPLAPVAQELGTVSPIVSPAPQPVTGPGTVASSTYHHPNFTASQPRPPPGFNARPQPPYPQMVSSFTSPYAPGTQGAIAPPFGGQGYSQFTTHAFNMRPTYAVEIDSDSQAGRQGIAELEG